ncbi:MAG TPA: tetratricopeptide repeat protein [Blastocatellia bacterium]|nr:tetratricopeptide repeat protein [Blastocatellia bacterium]
MNKYAFLRSNATMVIVCLLLGLIGGFKIANSQYRVQQNASLNRDIEQATSGMTGSQAQLNKIIEKAKANPNNAEDQLDAAAQLLQVQRPEEALLFLEQARKADPNDRRATVGVGVAHFMLRQYDQAIEFLKRSREQGAVSPFVTKFLLDSYIQSRKNLDEAERLLKELEAQGEDPAGLAQLRADLNAARSGGAATSDAAPGAQPKDGGDASKPKTVLSHGPEEPKPKYSQPRAQSGGAN